ncbi:hypothetical protein CFOL_v3_18233, partial [Cephalotus follicularis]
LDDSCKWRIHASLTPDNKTFMVKTLKYKHTCIRPAYVNKVSAKWIANKLGRKINVDPDMKYDLMENFLTSEYGVKPPQWQMYRARQFSREQIEGNHAKNDECNELPVFKRIFVCLHAMEIGFLKGCRPFIGFDRCHLKGPFGGVLLVAVSVDGNDCLF